MRQFFLQRMHFIVIEYRLPVVNMVSGVARVSGARGQTWILRPPPLKKFLKNDNKMSSIQLIMCIIISA